MMRQLKIFWHCPEIRRQLVMFWFWRLLIAIVIILALPFYLLFFVVDKFARYIMSHIYGPVFDYCESRCIAARNDANDCLSQKRFGAALKDGKVESVILYKDKGI